jgi:hypothetical protein
MSTRSFLALLYNVLQPCVSCRLRSVKLSAKINNNAETKVGT